ncbi:MAG: SusC/RagA family TonB-linked outer membrane protein [Gemmatimonadales bacterium]|nr:SusC/RagA family TonB-linked outer membrane protein [Gemmatimonadales bacterium]
MRRSSLPGLLRTGAVAAMLVFSAEVALAQQATITGKVTDAQGRPIGGASVLLGGLPNGGATNTSGVYTIVVAAASARGQTVSITARFLGKKPATKSITLTAGSQTVDFQLADDPLRLDELVVTGVSEATSTKKLAFAVGKVSADQLQETPGVTALGALAGKVSGVRLVETSGEPGTAPSIRLRGATSISGSQDPLIIIDGTITRLTMADIASEDIERVEVIKGAAASSLYGSDAANGVVQIFTKRGANLADGKLLVTTRNEGGASFLTKRIPNANAHSFKVKACDSFPSGVCFDRNAAGNRQAETDNVADNPYPQYFDHQDNVAQPGVFLTNYVSVGQRKGTTNFNASFQNTRTEGVIFGVKGFTRQNFRINVDQQLTPRLDLSFSSFYGRSNNNDADQGPGAPFFAVTFVEPNIDLFATNPDGSPYRAFIPDRFANASNPLYELFNRVRENDRSRFTGAGKLRWRIRDWLTAEGNYNFDQEKNDFLDTRPFGFLSATGQPTDGFLQRFSQSGRTYNTGATLTAIKTFGAITNTTKVSYIYEDQQDQQINAYADVLVVKAVPEFTAADPTSLNNTSLNEDIRNRNAFAVTTFDIKDRYILDALIRRDESSLFGPQNRKSTYYRLSGAWRANEDLKIGGIDELRLRASYGTAGLRPGFEYQYETLDVAAGSFTKATLGNKALRPAKSSELEVGANLELASGRVTIEYTYSEKNSKDQIQLVDLPSVVGFVNQWQNVGALKAKTHEVAVGLQLINSRDMALQLNITGDRTRQQITDYPLPERLYGGGSQAPEIFKLTKGVALGVMYGQRAVKSIDELYDDPAKAALSGAGQRWSRDSVVVNEEGYVVRRNQWRTSTERPIDYVDANGNNSVEIGDANPDFNMAFNPVFNWKRLAINGLVDWSQGGDIYNGTRQWPFFENRDRIYDQTGKPEQEKKSQFYYNYFYNGLNGQQFFVESGTYVKIKELAVHYTFDRNQLKKIGLGRLENLRIGAIGRNLFTFTNYSGYDPEVGSPFANDPYQVRFDWFTYPKFRTFTGLVEIAF